MSDEAVGGASPPEPARPDPGQPPQPAAPEGGQAEAKAVADAHDPGDLDGLVTALTNDMERRTRTLQAAALEAAWRHLTVEAGRPQIGNQVFNVFGPGSFDGGTGPSERDQRSRDSQAIPQGTLERVRKTFVPPAGYTRLWRNIEENALLVLKGAPGSGRVFATLHLLDAVCAGRVRRFHRDVELSQLAREDFAEGTGYLVEQLSDRSARATQTDQLEALGERLRSRNARMVIVTAEVTEWSPVFTKFVGEVAAPDATLVLRQHLLADLDPEYHEAADHLLKQEDVTATLARLTADRCSVSEVYGFACRLGRVVRGEQELADGCAAVDRSGERFATWFRGLPEPEDRTFAIALGVLDGLPYAAVTAASGSLGAHIQRVEKPNKPPRARVFYRTTRELLEQTRAISDVGSEETGYGSVPVPTVQSEMPGYSQRLLWLIWDEYPGMYPILLAWLRELAVDPDPRVRARAATAVGMIARTDFFRTCEQVLLPWARSWNPVDRQAAVAALWLPVREPTHAAVVWNLVEDWLDEKRALPMRLTGAAALGTSVGRGDYPRALGLLGRRAETTNYRLKQTICQAVTNLFGAAPTVELARLVLDTVADWVTDRQLERLHTALGSFLQLALDRQWESPGGSESWPMLLRLIQGDAERRLLTAELWRQALNRVRFDRAAVEVLHQWVRAAELRPYLREPLRVLVTAVPASARDFRTLRYHLRQWSVGEEPLPRTTALLLQSLSSLEVIHHAAV